MFQSTSSFLTATPHLEAYSECPVHWTLYSVFACSYVTLKHIPQLLLSLFNECKMVLCIFIYNLDNDRLDIQDGSGNIYQSSRRRAFARSVPNLAACFRGAQKFTHDCTNSYGGIIRILTAAMYQSLRRQLCTKPYGGNRCSLTSTTPVR